MFEQQEGVADALLVAEFDELLLQGQGFGVGGAAELEQGDHLQ